MTKTSSDPPAPSSRFFCAECGARVSIASRFRRQISGARVLFCDASCRNRFLEAAPTDAASTETQPPEKAASRWWRRATGFLFVLGAVYAGDFNPQNPAEQTAPFVALASTLN